NANYAAQIYSHSSGEDWFLRKLIAGSWGEWRTLYHSGNFNPNNYVPTTRTITVNGTPYALSSNISFTTPNTTYSAGTGLTLTGTEFTPTFGTTSGTVAQGNHTHDTATVSVSGFMTPYD